MAIDLGSTPIDFADVRVSELTIPAPTAAITRSRAGAMGLDLFDGTIARPRNGELFGLLGPNGAGKTTTIGILTTRVLPTSGRAIISACRERKGGGAR